MSDIRNTGPVSGSMPTTGRWGWYEDHESRIYRRVSTLVKKVETDRDQLDKWKLRQVLIGAARRGDIITGVKAMGAPDPMTGWTKEQKKLQDEFVEKATEAAKDSDGAITGTAMHTLTERVDRGEDVDAVAAGLPATVGTDLRAYAAMRRLNGWRSVEIERTVVNDELEVAGTFDRVDVVPGLAALLGPGECQYDHPGDQHLEPELPVIADVKTEASPTMNGLHIGPQLAIYSRARRMWVPNGRQVPARDRSGNAKFFASGDPIMIADGEYQPAPCVRQDVAIVVHVRDGDAVPYFIDLSEGWEAALAAHQQLRREQRARTRVGGAGAWFAPVPNVKRPAPAELLTDHAVAERYGHVDRPETGGPVVAHQAVRRPDGLVEWEPDNLARSLVREIWLAATTERLGELWELARQHGVPWRGPVEQAGAARARIIDCPQREMHNPATTSKCACGWTREVSP